MLSASDCKVKMGKVNTHSDMNQPMNIKQALEIIEKELKGTTAPVVDLIAVQTSDPFRVLVATILSARTRDEVTARAARRLFKTADKPASLTRLSKEDISDLIYPVGFYRNKARYLKDLPAALTPFNNKVPDNIKDLLTLPGVGRKTANLVLAVAFKKPAICVDTHVHRIMNIWGYIQTKTPLQSEMALRKKLPEEHWLTINSLLVSFGQTICRPPAPHCDRCPLTDCPRLGVKPRRSPTAPQNNQQKIICWNVNGIRAMEKKGLIDIIHDLAPDILALQETKAQPDQLSEDLHNIPGYHVYWHSAQRKGYSGTAVYSRQEPKEVIYGLDDPEFDREGRVLTLEYHDFFLINVYFPNSAHELKRLDYKLRFNRALADFSHKLKKEKATIICGDFNVAHKAIDLKNPKANEGNPGYTMEEREWMDHFLASGYVDSFRLFNSEGDHYTWWSYRYNARARNIGWRIDYFCVDEKNKHRIKKAAILDKVMGSDHCPIQLDFETG